MQLKTFTRGTGPDVLLLHGIGSSGTAWERVAQCIGDAYQTRAVDLPGYGDSPSLEAPDLDAVCEAVLSSMENRPHHVVGVSFGALVSLRLALRYPAMVRSLALADATLGRGYLAPPEKQKWLDHRRTLSTGLHVLAHERARQIAAPSASDNVVREIAQHMRRARADGYMTVANIIASTDAREWLHEIQTPALVFYGEEDAVTGAEMSRTLEQALPKARVATIPKAGHAPHIESPDAFASLLRSFLDAFETAGNQP